MEFDFKVYEIRKESRYYKNIVEESKKPNEFIIVGEEVVGSGEKALDCFKVHQVGEKGLVLISGLNIEQSSFLIPKSDLTLKKDDFPGIELQEFDIPITFLNKRIIRNIKRLNE